MDWDSDATDHRPRYRLCRLGFFLVALAAGVMTLDAAGHVALLLSFRRPLRQFLGGDFWQWTAGSAIVWGALLGSVPALGTLARAELAAAFGHARAPFPGRVGLLGPPAR